IMIIREEYIQELLKYKDSPDIKIITGMRRVGKSTILLIYLNELKKQGVSDKNITYINFDSMKYEKYRDYKELYNYLTHKIIPNEQNYIIIDEIQDVKGWEKVIRSISTDYNNVDIYITGSNANLLSSELATLLSGRSIEINVFPLSFKEFIQFDEEYNNVNYSDVNLKDKFQQYLKYGSLPVIFNYNNPEDIFENLILGIYNTVLIKDVYQRNDIKNTLLFENIVRYTLDNIGNKTSSKTIAKYLKNESINTIPATILSYLKMLKEAYVFYPAQRYDIKGKKLLKTLCKYYVSDIGIRNAILGFKNIDYGHIIENIVYLELLRRGYKVYIGKINNYEIDFIATNVNEKTYYQVSYSIKDPEVLEREIRPFKYIKDNYEKVVLTMDKNISNDYDGIKFINIIDFLLKK
ncbi:MAG: ATP-binding protein, partial [Methanobacteriaceae archaeon]|nr:ATP-binding protein [Methanobacteriaceae archaeon]